MAADTVGAGTRAGSSESRSGGKCGPRMPAASARPACVAPGAPAARPATSHRRALTRSFCQPRPGSTAGDTRASLVTGPARQCRCHDAGRHGGARTGAAPPAEVAATTSAVTSRLAVRRACPSKYVLTSPHFLMSIAMVDRHESQTCHDVQVMRSGPRQKWLRWKTIMATSQSSRRIV